MHTSLEGSAHRWMALLVVLSPMSCRTEMPPAEASILQEGHIIQVARGIGVRGQVPGSIRVGSLKLLSETVPTWRLAHDSTQGNPTGEGGRINASVLWPVSYEWEATVDDSPPVFNVALPCWWRAESAHARNPLQPPEPWWVETACLKAWVGDEQGLRVAGRTVMAEGVEYMEGERGRGARPGEVRGRAPAE